MTVLDRQPREGMALSGLNQYSGSLVRGRGVPVGRALALVAAATGLALAAAGTLLVMGVDLGPLAVPGLYGETVDAAYGRLEQRVQARRIQLDDWITARQRDLFLLSVDAEVQAQVAALVAAEPGSAIARAARERLDVRLFPVLGSEFDELFVTTLDGEILYSTLEQRAPTRAGQHLRVILDNPARLDGFVTSPYYEAGERSPYLLALQPAAPPDAVRAVALLGGRLSPAKLVAIVAGVDASDESGAYTAYMVTRAVVRSADPAANPDPTSPDFDPRYGREETRYLATVADAPDGPPQYSSRFVSDTMGLLPDLTDKDLPYLCRPSGAAYTGVTGARMLGASCVLRDLSSALVVEQPEDIVLQPLYTALVSVLVTLGALFVVLVTAALIAILKIAGTRDPL